MNLYLLYLEKFYYLYLYLLVIFTIKINKLILIVNFMFVLF